MNAWTVQVKAEAGGMGEWCQTPNAIGLHKPQRCCLCETSTAIGSWQMSGTLLQLWVETCLGALDDVEHINVSLGGCDQHVCSQHVFALQIVSLQLLVMLS